MKRALVTLALLALLLPTSVALSLPTHVAPAPVPDAPLPVGGGELPRLVAAQGGSLGASVGKDYSLTFECPPAQMTLDVAGNGARAAGCPNRIVDEDDLLGNPALAVDPVVPGRYAFASLHGQPARGSPASPIARDGQTHTTFSTVALGDQWTDQPYYPPQAAFPDGRHVLGLDVDALIDEQRTLHVASLYAHQGAGNDPWNYTIVLWKFSQELREGSRQGLTQTDYDLVNAAFHNRLPGSVIDNLWLLEDKGDNLVYLLWHERAGPNATLPVKGLGNVTSWIAGAVTTADAVSSWARLPDSMLVGGCATPSNPVLAEGRILIACEAGAQGEPLLHLGPHEIGLRAMVPALRAAQDEGKTPLVNGTLRLAANARGDVALLTARVVFPNGTTAENLTKPNARSGGVNVTANTSVVAQIATRGLDGSWSRPHDFGDKIHNASSVVRAARFNAALYRDASDVIHVIFLEERVSNRTEKEVPRWSKHLLAIDPVGTVVFDADLNLSDKGQVFGGRAAGDTTPYGDTRDSLVDVHGEEFIGFADYAVLVFAKVVEHDQRVAPAVQEVPPPVAEALPAVESVATATGIGLGATAAVGAGALVARKVALAHGQGRGKR